MHSNIYMLQVICHGKSYISAVQKMQRALCESMLRSSHACHMPVRYTTMTRVL